MNVGELALESPGLRPSSGNFEVSGLALEHPGLETGPGKVNETILTRERLSQSNPREAYRSDFDIGGLDVSTRCLERPGLKARPAKLR